MTPSPRMTPAVVLGGALLLSLIIAVVVYAAVDERVQKRFDLAVDDTTDRISARLQTIESVLYGGRAQFSASGEVSREQFHRYVAGVELPRHAGGVIGIGFVPMVTPAQREELVVRARAEGLTDFHIWPERGGDPQSMVLYIEPLDARNRRVLGFDLMAEPTRRAAMLRARDQGQAALSGKVELVQERDAAPRERQAGFVMFVPIYAGEAEPKTVAERRALLRGYIYAPFGADDLFAGIFEDDPPPVSFRVYAGDRAVSAALLHDSAATAHGNRGGELQVERGFGFAGQHWRLAFASRPGFVSSFERSLPGLLGLIGVCVAFLLYRLTSAEARARDLAEVRQREAERISRELDQFAYAASHDLKAPLRGIASLAHWLEEDLGGDLPASARHQFELLQGRVVRLESLIEGMLRYARAGRPGSELERVDVAALLAEVVGLLAPPRDAVVTIAPDMPTLTTERAPLQQVFMNLVSNSIKYAGKTDPHVDVDYADDGNFWCFTVHDDGPGIEPQYHERVWGMFQTLQPRDRVESPGIGLAVVRKVVEARGGQAWIDSSGSGATFHFTWPKLEPAQLPEAG